MTRYLAGVLTVIAVGILLIAYGLLASPAFAPDDGSGGYAQPMLAAQRFGYGDAGPTPPYWYWRPADRAAANDVRPVQASQVVQVPRTVRPGPARAGRDWRKTALVIGGSSAAGAGVGAMFGGRKGALIGAAIGGGGSALYEASRR
jgi:hypothetical protein